MRIAAFDFDAKKEWASDRGDSLPEAVANLFYWIESTQEEHPETADFLASLGVPPEVADLLKDPKPENLLELYEKAVHFTVSEGVLKDGVLETQIIACLLGERFMVTVAPGESYVMDRIRRIYQDDFLKFAMSPGFLLYELGSQLLESYRRIFTHYADQAERVQLRLFGKVTDTIFSEVSELTGDILAFRRTVLSSRDLFNDLASRKSQFVAETTQPTLDVLSDRMGRLCDDIAGIRSVLNETLNLYMGMVSHRTNRIINRLTIFSMLFLPLSFLAGVYGMNFVVLPELHWKYAYPAFWGFVVVFVSAFVIFVKKKRWI